MKNKKSEYIRLDYNETQTVTTNLVFDSEVSVPDATRNNQPVNLGQLERHNNQIKNEIIQALPSTQGAVTKISFRLEGLNTYNEATGASIGSMNQYAGLAGITFCTKDGQILTPVGWSWGRAEFDAVTAYNNYRSNKLGVFKLYYAVQTYVHNQISAQRKLMYEPTQEDKDYLTNLGYPIVCVHICAENNFSFPASQNYYDWSNPLFAFKQHGQRFLYTSGQNSTGMLTANSLVATNYIDFWIEDDDFNSVTNFNQNVVGVTFGASFSAASNYGAPVYQFTMHKNNYREINERVVMGTGRFYAFVNISEDEQYNNFEFSDAFLATYGSTANINYLQLGFKARVKYDNINKTYTVEVN